MPLIRIDYNQKDINEQLVGRFVSEMLDFAKTLHGMSDDQISIFTKPFSSNDHSTASAEIEVRAKLSEYGDEFEKRRSSHMDAYPEFIGRFKEENSIDRGIVFTITLEEWTVNFIQ